MSWKLVNRLANVAVIVAAVLWAVGVGYYQRLSRANATHTNIVQPPYSLGEKLPALGGIDYGASEYTLVMVIQSGCQFCTNSLPFYKRLLIERDKKGTRGVRIIAAMPEDDSSAHDYLVEHDFHPDSLVRFERGSVRVKGTPALLWVDRAGFLQNMWEGQLLKLGEEDVLKVLSASKTSQEDKTI